MMSSQGGGKISQAKVSVLPENADALPIFVTSGLQADRHEMFAAQHPLYEDVPTR